MKQGMCSHTLFLHMNNLASNYSIQLPDSNGPTFCLRSLDCAELETVQHGALWQSFGQVGFDGKPYEVGRFTQFSQNSGLLLMTEEEWDIFQRLTRGCTVNLHRTHCTDKVVEIYTDVTPLPITKRKLVSNGLLGANDIPSVQVPFIFNELRRIITGQGYHLTDSPNQMEDTIVGITFCNCENCCDGGACTNIFKLTESGSLFVSSNEGVSWSEIYTCLPDNLTDLSCVNGRLFAPSTKGLYWADADYSGEWAWVLRNYEVTHVVGDDLIIYALAHDYLGSHIFRSLDGGTEWELVIVVDNIDYIAARRKLLVYSDSNKLFTYDDGEWIESVFSEPIIALDIDVTSVFGEDCGVAFVALQSNAIYKGYARAWRRIYSGEELVDNGTPAKLITMFNGSAVYYSRLINGIPTVLTSYDCCTWNTSIAQVNTGELCRQLSTIENEPVWGCLAPDGTILEVYRVPCVEPPKTLNCNDFVWGCWDDDIATIFSFANCADECDVQTFIGESNLCELCNCDDCICTTCIDPACGLTYTNNLFVDNVFGPCIDNPLSLLCLGLDCDDEVAPTGCGYSGCFEIEDGVIINQPIVYGYLNETGTTVSIWGCEPQVISEITLPEEVYTIPNIILPTDYIALMKVSDCCEVYDGIGNVPTSNNPYCGEDEVVIGETQINVCDECHVPGYPATCGLKTVFDVCETGLFVALTSEVLINK